MTKRLILFLIRRRLGLKKFQYFKFTNQKNNSWYYFGNDGLMKTERDNYRKSSVGLNWLLDDRCTISKIF